MISRCSLQALKRHPRKELMLKHFSSYYGGGAGAGGSSSFADSQTLRAYPQYSVFGENCMLALKLLPPAFQVLKSRTLVVERKGRLLIEWSARTPDGSVDRERQVRFGLSPEEVGLIIDQLPQHEVELTRYPHRNSGDFASVSQPGAAQKVLTLTPRNGGVVAFKIHYEAEGPAGSALSSPGREEAGGPLEVLVQLGEFRVMCELMRSSIPVLVGWDMQLKIALERTTDQAKRGQGSSSSNSASLNDIPF
jgi:hypothetical protein